MLRYAADREGTQPIVALYPARIPEEFVFRSEFNSIERKHPHLETRYAITRPEEPSVRWIGRTGRIDEGWMREAVQGMDQPKGYVARLPPIA